MVAAMCAGLVGCGSAELDDLRDFTTDAYADRKPTVEPLPQIKPHQGFTYQASELTDPFAIENLRPVAANPLSSTSGRAPDPNRRREPLEQFPLDSLRMVGTLQQRDAHWVVVRAPDGTVHHAQKGNYIGQNYGVITEVTEEVVDIKELIQDPNGSWIDRDANLAIAAQE
jgi:type IV pilus assembly protein PilP